MSANGLYIKILPPGEVATRLAKMATVLFQPTENATINVSTNSEGIRLELGNIQAHQLGSRAEVRSFAEGCAQHKSLLCTNAFIHSPQNPTRLTYTAIDPLTATLTFTYSDLARGFKTQSAIEELFETSTYYDLVAARDPAEKSALQFRERGIATLEKNIETLVSLQADIIKRDTEARREAYQEQERQYAAKSAALAKAHEEKEKALEEKHLELTKALEAKEETYRAKLAAFETRESKYIRRELLSRIETLLKENETYKISKDTEDKRKIVHSFTRLLLAASFSVVVAIVAAVLYDVIALGQAPPLRLLLPLGAFSLTFVTTMVYYLKWNDRWFREHADNEMAAKRYKADILRASWVAELVLEWKAENHRTPTELVSAFTRSLFRDVGTSRESEHPLDSLTGVLKRASSFSLGKGMLSVEAEPRAKKSKKSGVPASEQ